MELPDSERIRCSSQATPQDTKLKKECVVPFRKTRTTYKLSLYDYSEDRFTKLGDDIVTSEQVISKGTSPLDDNDKNDCEFTSPTSNKASNGDVNNDYGGVRNFIPTAPCIKLALLSATAKEQQLTTPTSNKDDGTDDDDYDPYYGDLRNFVINNFVPPPLDVSLLKGSDFSSDSDYESESHVAALDGGDAQE